MAVFYDITKLPAFHNAVITIGTFDGVHLGHRAILGELKRLAAERHGESVVLTFEPHPRKLLFPDQPLKLLTPLSKKVSLIMEAGIQHVVVIPFTKEFANLSATEYIEQFLVKNFHPDCIIIGYDHKFGHDRTGDISLLKQYAGKCHYHVDEIPAQLIDAAAVSSTKIRKALNDGRVAEATHMLGRPYSVEGTVIAGAQRGRTIGYPTANIRPSDPEQLVPANGVYAVRVRHNETWLNGMLNIGFNPTVTTEKIRHIEVNLFDFNADIYNETLEVAFISRLRDEKKFGSLDELKQALHNDKETATQILTPNP
ncbi:bifunctional riboflavin kinase/FAD synthetase [Taibaiella soli]|uniref:Riboflavin biosynthesis protein n=1 Tax=Taibaiella soli TaxID=1649169 RepID=A0A2W2APW5_9BACT|nr:bifunctional riboflavin kinase/FAD synthetase [Taibaiella soli]PZF74450.1 riboflavin biosynthesis protein RibF [Taibaiella soli]